MWGGAVRLANPMLFALGFIAQFTIGGLSGVMHSIVPTDTQQTDTYFVVAHFHYVLFGGLVFAIFGGFYYWWPKVFGKMLNETLGKLNFWLMVIGFNLTFFPMHFLGFEGQPRRTYTYPNGHGLGHAEPDRDDRRVHHRAVGARVPRERHLHAAARPDARPTTRGTRARSSGSTSSPPPEYNFAEVPVVTHRDEFWHRKYTEDDEGRLVKLPAGAAVDTAAQLDRAGAAQHPHAVAVVLAVRVRARAADHGLRLRVQELVAPRRGCRGRVLRAQRRGRSNRRPNPTTTASAQGSALMTQARRTRRRARATSVPPHGDRATPRRNTGVSNTKLGDLAVPVVGGAVLRRVHLDVLPLPRPRRAVPRRARRPHELLNIPFTSVTSFVLLMSSLTMVLALAAIQRGDHRRLRIWLLATAFFGLTFIGGQVYEFTEFYREGLHLGTNLFGTTFFVLTGLHGAHVTIGIIWLLSLWGRSMQGRLEPEQVRGGRDRRSLLALRRHRVDLHLHRHLPDPSALSSRGSTHDRSGHRRRRAPGTERRRRRRRRRVAIAATPIDARGRVERARPPRRRASTC